METPDTCPHCGVEGFRNSSIGVVDNVIHSGVLYWQCRHCWGKVPRFSWYDPNDTESVQCKRRVG